MKPSIFLRVSYVFVCVCTVRAPTTIRPIRLLSDGAAAAVQTTTQGHPNQATAHTIGDTRSFRDTKNSIEFPFSFQTHFVCLPTNRLSHSEWIYYHQTQIHSFHTLSWVRPHFSIYRRARKALKDTEDFPQQDTCLALWCISAIEPDFHKPKAPRRVFLFFFHTNHARDAISQFDWRAYTTRKIQLRQQLRARADTHTISRPYVCTIVLIKRTIYTKFDSMHTLSARRPRTIYIRCDGQTARDQTKHTTRIFFVVWLLVFDEHDDDDIRRDATHRARDAAHKIPYTYILSYVRRLVSERGTQKWEREGRIQ